MAELVGLKNQSVIINKVKKSRQTVILVGGCFDILHIGHIRFLQAAKKMGDILVLLLESDEKVKKLKGKSRPVFLQKERAEMLSFFPFLDYIILLPPMERDSDYDNLIFQLKPNIIVVTENDPLLAKKKLQAQKIGGRIKIIPYVQTFSSSKLARILGVD